MKNIFCDGTHCSTNWFEADSNGKCVFWKGTPVRVTDGGCMDYDSQLEEYGRALHYLCLSRDTLESEIRVLRKKGKPCKSKGSVIAEKEKILAGTNNEIELVQEQIARISSSDDASGGYCALVCGGGYEIH